MQLLKRILVTLLRYLLASVGVAVVLYALFALFFHTDEERHLLLENQLYQERYQRMSRQEAIIGGALDGLRAQDDAIYGILFGTEAPTPESQSAADFIALSDSLSESFFLSATESASASLMQMAGQVDAAFEDIFRALLSRKDSIPPLSMPLEGVSYVQTGASVGEKLNPVYKLSQHHDGLDIIVPQGTNVYAAADGVITRVVHSRKGLGNIVEIDHGNGYITRYCLLADMYGASGRRVKRGQRIGTVGISAQVTAPHLHYEVLHNGEVLDPVNYLYLSLSPEDYARVLYMAARTVQSLD